MAAAGSSDDGLGGLVRQSQLAWVRRFSREGCGYRVANGYLRFELGHRPVGHWPVGDDNGVL